MQDAICLLARNGIVRVSFARPLSSEEALAVLDATKSAASVDELEVSLNDLGSLWGIATLTEVVSRKNGE